MLKSSFKESPMIPPNPKSVLDTGYTSRKGRREGRKEGLEHTSSQLLQRGTSLVDIADITGLTPCEIEAIQAKNGA